MNKITTDGFEAGLASKKTDSLISKMVSAWESKNAKSAAKVSGLTLMAVSLAACGGSSSDDASGGGDDASGDDSTTTITAMTTGTDDISGADVVTGTISQSSVLTANAGDLSTYNLGDEVSGDDDNQLDITIGDLRTTASATITFTAPAVTVSDISTVVLIDENGNDTLILDATNYDDSVQNITLETNTGGSTFEATVENLTANGDSFTLALNPMTDSDTHILVNDAELADFTNLDAQMTALGDNDGASASFGTISDSGDGVKVIELSAGIEGAAEIFLELTDDGFAASGPAAVGPLTLDITAAAAKQGEVELDVTYAATGAENTATVGDFEIVDFDVTLAKQAGENDGTHVTADIGANGNMFSFDVDASVSSVTTGTGSASIGTTTISDIVITGANQSEVEAVFLYQDADLNGVGNASIDDVTIGDVTVALGNGGYMSLEYDHAADVTGTGDASVGARTIGDISITVGDNAKNVWAV